MQSAFHRHRKTCARLELSHERDLREVQTPLGYCIFTSVSLVKHTISPPTTADEHMAQHQRSPAYCINAYHFQPFFTATKNSKITGSRGHNSEISFFSRNHQFSVFFFKTKDVLAWLSAFFEWEEMTLVLCN